MRFQRMNSTNLVKFPEIPKLRKPFHRSNVATPFAHSDQHFARPNFAKNRSSTRRQRNNPPPRTPPSHRTPNSRHREKRITDPLNVCFPPKHSRALPFLASIGEGLAPPSWVIRSLPSPLGFSPSFVGTAF